MKLSKFLLLSSICLISQIAQAKPVVAISSIDAGNDENLANNFTSLVETAIEQTNKFRVMERRQLNKLLGEQNQARAGLVTTNTPGKAGGFEGADYLIYGSINAAQVTRKHNIGSSLVMGMLSAGRGGNTPDCSNAVSTMVVSVKITDAKSGEVKFTKAITETQKSETDCSGNAQVDAASLLKDAADKVANGLVMAVYPIQIAANQPDGSFVLNYGEGSLTPGTYLTIYQKGEDIKDPASGEVIGTTETKLGVVQVTEVTGRLSKATAATPFAATPPVGSIARITGHLEEWRFWPEAGGLTG